MCLYAYFIYIRIYVHLLCVDVRVHSVYEFIIHMWPQLRAKQLEESAQIWDISVPKVRYFSTRTGEESLGRTNSGRSCY